MISRAYLLSQTQAYHTGSPEAVHSPVHGGIAVYVKIPNYGFRHVGTLSGIVIDRTSRTKYLLSNQHVFFPYSAGSAVKPGLPVYMTGDPNKAIAKTFKTKAESNPWPADKKNEAIATIGTYHDSAIATASVPVSNVVNNIGTQRGMIEPKAGMRVKFFGRTSRLQRGVITKPDVNNINDVGNGKIQVQKHIIYADMASAPGDSGSLVFNDDNRVVGIHFAKASNGANVICRASAVEQAYNVVFSEDELSGTTPTPTPQPTPVPTPKPPFSFPKLELPEINLNDKATQGFIILGGIGLVIVTFAAAAASSNN